MIAALFVEKTGPYSSIPGVDVWDQPRVARLYNGPWPVVAHPPCARWGQYATGGPNPKAKRRIVGDDGSCFESALLSVMVWGGVLEHPQGSKAWKHHGLKTPSYHGGWSAADNSGGWTCAVAQGHYGHVAQKMTWLYACGIQPPELIRGPCPGRKRLDTGYRSKQAAKTDRAKVDYVPITRLTWKEQVLTPMPFAQLLVAIAQTAAQNPHNG